MSDQKSNPHEDREVFREALRRWDAGTTVPGFESVHRRIAASPSPLEQPRWSMTRSLGVSASLTWAQLRIVPWLVVPVGLVTVTMAVLTARFFGVSHDSSAAVTSFSSLLLVGIAVTVTMALSTSRPDAVSLATPLGPQVVVLARVGMVLVVDALVGIAASVIVSAWGVTGGLAAVLAGWLVPLALVAGLVTFVSIWVTPWAGVVAGVVLVPLVSPPSATTMSLGFGAGSGALREAITPVGVVVVGLLLLALAVGSARRALTANPAAI